MKALIVIDCQVDFLTGVLGSDEAARIIPNVKNKIEEYIQNGDEILYTQDTHSEETYFKTQEGQNLPILHCVQGTKGWEAHGEGTKNLLQKVFENGKMVSETSLKEIRERIYCDF